jgi:hypothetical protein
LYGGRGWWCVVDGRCFVRVFSRDELDGPKGPYGVGSYYGGVIVVVWFESFWDGG